MGNNSFRDSSRKKITGCSFSHEKDRRFGKTEMDSVNFMVSMVDLYSGSQYINEGVTLTVLDQVMGTMIKFIFQCFNQKMFMVSD